MDSPRVSLAARNCRFLTRRWQRPSRILRRASVQTRARRVLEGSHLSSTGRGLRRRLPESVSCPLDWLAGWRVGRTVERTSRRGRTDGRSDGATDEERDRTSLKRHATHLPTDPSSNGNLLAKERATSKIILLFLRRRPPTPAAAGDGGATAAAAAAAAVLRCCRKRQIPVQTSASESQTFPFIS